MKLRRLAISLAATAVATTAAIAGASSASAAGDAQSCLNALTGPGSTTPTSITYPAPG